DQVLDERRLGGLDLLVLVLVAHAVRLRSAGGGGAKSFSVTAGAGSGSGSMGSSGGVVLAGSPTAASAGGAGRAATAGGGGRRRRRGRSLGRFPLGAVLEVTERIEAGVELAGGLVDVLLEIGHLRFAHRLAELILELGGHAPDLGRPLTDRAQNAGQFLGTD